MKEEEGEERRGEDRIEEHGTMYKMNSDIKEEGVKERLCNTNSEINK